MMMMFPVLDRMAAAIARLFDGGRHDMRNLSQWGCLATMLIIQKGANDER